VIKSFKHKGLQKLFETGSTAGIQSAHKNRLLGLLDRLNAAVIASDMDFPGSRFHALKGTRKGQFSVRVSGNWRVTFEFKNGDAYVVNYEDYH